MASQIDRVDKALSATAMFIIPFLPKKHQYPAIRRPGGTFIKEAFAQHAFTGAIGPHYTNEEAAFMLTRKGNQIPSR
tara:strand:- start:58 stop:288 length:231 start_codon:yes stop_codon:yes gene_type:complete